MEIKGKVHYMPYKSEHIKLPQNLDRRRKLSDADKSEILRRYKVGEMEKRGKK